MNRFGTMGVDWEPRINYDRLREERLVKAEKALEESDADVLFVFRTEDARYLTGFRSHLHPVSFLGNAVVILPKGGEPILFSMDQEHAQARMPWLPKENIRPRANLREGSGLTSWIESIKAELGDFKGGKIGVDIWTPPLAKGLQEAFSEAEFVDGYKILMNAKIIKTEDEVECLKTANAITEAGMDAALEYLRPGVRENEVLAVSWKVMTDLGSEWTQCSNIVCSGPYTAPYRRFTSDRIIQAGDLVIIDIGGCYNGYWGDLTRTWVAGDIDATDAQRDLHQKCYDSLFNACGQAKPGNTNADVYEAAYPYVLDSLGHGSGLSPWEPPYFSPASAGSTLTLKVGMQFNLEPYAGKPGLGGIRLENNLIVTEDGPDIYTTYPFDPRLVKEVHALDTSTGRMR